MRWMWPAHLTIYQSSVEGLPTFIKAVKKIPSSPPQRSGLFTILVRPKAEKRLEWTDICNVDYRTDLLSHDLRRAWVLRSHPHAFRSP